MESVKKPLGTGDSTKTDELSENFQGGGDHFQSKNLYCRFWTFKQGFLSIEFEEEKIPLWFSENEGENSSVLVPSPVPY